MSLERNDRPSVTCVLAERAVTVKPRAEDVALADRALLDTVAVGLAAREEPILDIAAVLPKEAQWAVGCHIIDFDDLHLPSTTHVSSVCVPLALSLDGGRRSYLAGAGVTARVGTAMGFAHYAAGWHASTTAGAIGAAAGAAVALGLDADRVGRAMALAVPAAGGVQRSFGTDAKSLQIGFAAHAGVRAVRLAAGGATAAPFAVDEWMGLLGGSTEKLGLSGSAIPGALAIKLVAPAVMPCNDPSARRAACAPKALMCHRSSGSWCARRGVTVKPLIHSLPRPAWRDKFRLEYAIVAALLERHISFATFSDEQVRRPQAIRLVELVEVDLTDGEGQLLSGEVTVQVHTTDGVRRAPWHTRPAPGRTRPPLSTCARRSRTAWPAYRSSPTTYLGIRGGPLAHSPDPCPWVSP